MRRPAAILVDRELNSVAFGLFDERAAGREILDEGLLRQDMLAGLKGAPHQACSHVRVGRQVDDLDPGIPDRLFEVVRRVSPRKESVAARARARRITRANHENVQSIGAVGVEVRCADPAGADERDADRTVLWHRREIGQFGRWRFGGRMSRQRVVARRRLELCFRFGHGSNGNVRRSLAERAAVSTIR